MPAPAATLQMLTAPVCERTSCWQQRHKPTQSGCRQRDPRHAFVQGRLPFPGRSKKKDSCKTLEASPTLHTRQLWYVIERPLARGPYPTHSRCRQRLYGNDTLDADSSGELGLIVGNSGNKPTQSRYRQRLYLKKLIAGSYGMNESASAQRGHR